MKTVSFPGGFTPPITGGPFFGGPEGQKEALKLAFDPGAILDGISSLFRGDFKRALDKLTDGLGGAKSKGPKKLAKEAFEKLKGLLGRGETQLVAPSLMALAPAREHDVVLEGATLGRVAALLVQVGAMPPLRSARKRATSTITGRGRRAWRTGATLMPPKCGRPACSPW